MLKTIHSNSIVFQNKGILILGKPASGKTTLAIEILKRGGIWISDDITKIETKSDGKIKMSAIEESPRLHIREKGIIFLKDEFPKAEFKNSYNLDLIITLGNRDVPQDLKNIFIINLNDQNIKDIAVNFFDQFDFFVTKNLF